LRDILTVLASIVILILATALVAPPFIDWEARRDVIDQAIARAAGTEARTEGRIGVRLLPSPRVRVDRLRLGSPTPDAPSLTADFLWSEMELMPLLRGEVRFRETRVGRADIRIPVSPSGDWQLPPDLVASSGRAREWAIENLQVAQLLVTTQVPTTGRTDQLYADAVSINGQSLVGPWRVEGSTAGIPFRLVTTALAPDKNVQVKLSGGGDIYPRFDVDAKLALDAGTGGPTPGITGKARVLFGPPAQAAAAGIPIPVAVESTFKTNGSAVVLDEVVLEAGEGGASLRMTGNGRIQTDDPRISLKLEGRRLDADSFILSSSGQDFAGRLRTWTFPRTTIPIDLDLSLNSIGLAQEELTNAVFRGSIAKGRAQVERFEFVAPGETRVAVEGSIGLNTQGGANGRVAFASAASDRFARYLERVKLSGAFLRAFDGRPVEAATDFLLDWPIVSFRNARVKSADATLTGNARFTAPEGDQRGRLEAQVAVRGLNLDQLPQVSSIFDATQNLDVGFILDARDVRAGSRPEAGRITARILSDGPALLVESLTISDLAGANANVSGRIQPDGSGRIAGKVTAKRAAPLVDLLGGVWIGGVSKLVPHFLREGELSLDVVTEQAASQPGSVGPRLRTTARGTAAGGSFNAEVITVDGTTENLDVQLGTDNTGRWVDRPNAPLLRRPSVVNLRGTRVGSGRFNVTVAGDLGGVRVTTTRPFALSSGDDVVDSGEADIESADLTPFLVLLGDGAGVEPPVPVRARITLGRERDASSVTVSGRVGEGAVQANLAVRSRSDITGDVVLDRLSVPWLVTSLALHTPPDPNANAVWSTARFGQTGRLITGARLSVKAARLDLGRGLRGQQARFQLGVTPEGLSIRDLQAGFGGGQLSGLVTVDRQGPVASFSGEGSIRDVPLSSLAGPSLFDARLSGNLRFGATGETFAALVANLGGNGDVRLANVSVPKADPASLARALQRLLAEEDPLAQGRVEKVVTEEIGKASLSAPAVDSSVAIYGGGVRLFPFVAQGEAGAWQGTVSYDLKTLSVDARGVLTSKAAPKGWTGGPPSVSLSWRGSLAEPMREIEGGALRNALAAIVLQRELDKIDTLEREANERQRLQQRRDLERQRERDRQAAEEAARQARLRAEAERVKAETERAKADAEQRAREEATRRAAPQDQIIPSTLPPLPGPIDIRPPPQVQGRPGG
jgi:uncharacterized protein involved in outer membrane biogenesis